MKYLASILTALVMLNLIPSRIAHVSEARIDLLENAALVKTKKVRFSLIGDSNSPLVLKAGEDIIKLSPSEPVEVKLPTGTRIVVVDSGTQSHKIGDMIVEISSALSGAIVHIR